MKKQVLVVMPGSMELGGVERSLIGLLNSFDYEKYEVDLFLYGHHGPLMNLLPQEVNLLPEVKELAYLRSSFSEKIKNKCYVAAIYRIFDEVKSKLGMEVNYDNTWAKVMRRTAMQLKKNYDLAISFFLPFDFISEKVIARKRVGWIHTDYSKEVCNIKEIEEQYKKVDCIVAVSDSCKKQFCRCLPHLTSSVVTIENILPVNYVEAEAKAFVPVEMGKKGGISILSIGRYCHAKNFDNVPEICKYLVNKGLDVYWYIIGFGSDEELIKSKMKEFGMEERVILLGKRENPYPYIKNCDLYVQPSRYEGKCVAVREAQMLGKPVVITDYPTSKSQLEDGVDGIIVPMDNQLCADGIAELLNNSEKMSELSESCKKRDYSNSSEVEKIYQLME